MHPFVILLLGMAVVVGAIVRFRLNAFLALLLAAILVSLLSPGEVGQKITRVAAAFGSTAGTIGVVIALAAITGSAMKESGAADRIVVAFLSLLGERRAAAALACAGYVLAIPVFFDTVYFLLVPLAKSTYRRTGHDYLKYVMAIPAGGVPTHCLVPPTPGPLAVAGILGVDLGMMVMMGGAIAIPAAIAGLAFTGWLARRLLIPLREPETETSPQAAAAQQLATSLPPLLPSLLPIVLPVILIASNTVASSLAADTGSGFWAALVPYAAVAGNPNFALLMAAAIAMWVHHNQRRPSRDQAAGLVEQALMSGGIIILITAAGGAFGAMLREAQIGPAIQGLFSDGVGRSGVLFLLLGFAVSSLLKFAQGSSTVAMITAAGMLAAMITGPDMLPFHHVYLAAAISSGAMVGAWMNDSGFWVFARMSGLTEMEGLKTFTPVLAVGGVTALLATIVLAFLLPLR
jgi:GntP family gluconate:H+ symporter